MISKTTGLVKVFHVLAVFCFSLSSFAYDNIQKMTVNIKLDPAYTKELVGKGFVSVKALGGASIGYSRRGAPGIFKGGDDRGNQQAETTFKLEPVLQAQQPYSTLELKLQDHPVATDGNLFRYEYRSFALLLSGVKADGTDEMLTGHTMNVISNVPSTNSHIYGSRSYLLHHLLNTAHSVPSWLFMDVQVTEYWQWDRGHILSYTYSDIVNAMISE